jgi:hypothetical protein
MRVSSLQRLATESRHLVRTALDHASTKSGNRRGTPPHPRPAGVLALLMLVFALVACGATTTLEGRVLDAYTNQPIQSVSLRFGAQQVATTDANGKYATDAWSAKETLVLEAPGYEPVTLNLADNPELAQAQGRKESVRLDATLRPNTLAGVVKDAYTGQPVANAIVQATNEMSATTDTDGAYKLENVPETFQITVAAPDYAEASADIDRMTTLDVALRPNVLRGMVKDTYTDQPLAGVEVTAGDANTTTRSDGAYELKDIPENAEVRFTRDGYDTVQQPLPKATVLDASLRPNRISGTVVNAQDGQPLAEVELIVTQTATGTAVASTRTDADGRYTLDNVPEGAYIKALLPGYKRAATQVTPGTLRAELELEPFEAKALYVTANLAAAGLPAVNTYFDIIDRTELNAMVLDLKSDSLDDVGFIYYQSQAPAIVAAGTSADLMPIREILAEAKRRGIYMIARVQVFSHDNALLQKHPDWYVQQNGQPWFAHGNIAWLDVYDERVWDYNLQLAVEAAQLGFDEIQFDYIRFPSDGDLAGVVFKGPYDPYNDPEPMYNAIGRFLERAQRAINDVGAFFSVDVFGYVSWEPQPSIGQNLQVMGKYIDYVYPMVYPSHYVFGELGLGNPSEHPYEIVDHSMKLVRDQLQGEARRAKVRPWLQDFTLIWVPDHLIVEYGASEVRAQIDAAEANRENGVNGWALWNANSEFTVQALKPQ